MMYKIGTYVRYRKEWCEEVERNDILVIRENWLNPVTNEMTRYLVENLSYTILHGLHPTECVEEDMIEPL